MSRIDYWTMPIEELAEVAGKGGYPDSQNEATSKAASRVLNARAVSQTSKTSRHLVWATWALVFVTILVAVTTAFGG